MRLTFRITAVFARDCVQHRKSFGDVASTMGVVGPRESSYRPDEKPVLDEPSIPLPDEPTIPPPVSHVGVYL